MVVMFGRAHLWFFFGLRYNMQKHGMVVPSFFGGIYMRFKNGFFWSLVAVSSLCSAGSPVKISLYDDFAQVSETKSVESKVGDIRILEYGIPDSVDASSINFRSENARLRSFAYNTQTVSLDGILRERLGRKIRFFNVEDGIQNRTIIEGVLLSVNPIIIRDFGDKVYTHIDRKNIIVEGIPKHLHTRPNVELVLSPLQSAGAVKYELDYIAANLGCHPVYSVFVEKQKGVLDGSFEIHNKTNRDFENVNVSCVMGSVSKLDMGVSPLKMAAKVSGLQSGVSVGEYRPLKMFELPMQMDLERGSKRVVPFVSSEGLGVDFTNRFEDAKLVYAGKSSGRFERILGVTGSGSRVADLDLYGGVVKVYEKIGERNVFIGEGAIDFVPTGSPLKVSLGRTNSLFVEVETKIHSTKSLTKKEGETVLSYIETIGEKRFSIKGQESSKEDYLIELKAPKGAKLEILSDSCEEGSCSLVEIFGGMSIRGLVEGSAEVKVKYRVMSNQREVKTSGGLFGR